MRFSATHIHDEAFMRQALKLAADTTGLASPNPQVGCILVSNGEVIGEGAHIYDNRDQFWRFAEAHAITFANVPVVVNGVQVHYDLQSRRYVAVNLTNEEPQQVEYDWEQSPGYFTPQQLQKFATAGK